MVDDHAIDLPPSDHMVVVRNEDRTGMIGVVGTALGDAGVNVADMAVGHVGDGHSAIMVLSTGGPVSVEVLDDLRRRPGIISVRALDLV